MYAEFVKHLSVSQWKCIHFKGPIFDALLYPCVTGRERWEYLP